MLSVLQEVIEVNSHLKAENKISVLSVSLSLFVSLVLWFHLWGSELHELARLFGIHLFGVPLYMLSWIWGSPSVHKSRKFSAQFSGMRYLALKYKVVFWGPKLSHGVVYGQLKLIFVSIAGGCWATVQDERHMFPVRNHDVCTNVN